MFQTYLETTTVTTAQTTIKETTIATTTSAPTTAVTTTEKSNYIFFQVFSIVLANMVQDTFVLLI